MILTVALAVAVVLAVLWGNGCRRERDGAREVAYQAKQGWDAANERAEAACVQLIAAQKDRNVWMDATRRAMDRELKLLEDKKRLSRRLHQRK